MDALDVRILHAMGTQRYGRAPRPASQLRPASVAKRLRVSPERVKDRLKRMEKSGFIAGYGIYPNHRHLGLESSCYFYDFGADDEADRVAKELEPLEGVVGLYSFVGGVLCVNLAFRSPSELERRLRVLVSLSGRRGELQKFFDLEMPVVSRPLSNLDWRIVKALRGDAMRSQDAVAKDLGVSAKTVKRRFDRMSAEGSFFVVPEIDPSAAEGCIMFYIAVFLEPDATRAALTDLRRVMDPHLVAVDNPSNLGVCHDMLMCCAWSMAEVDRLRRKAASVDGVASVRPFMFRGAVETAGWLDEAIDERIKATTA